MANKRDELSKRRTELAEMRTDLARRRTTMSDLRTSSNAILFGLAFIGFSETRWDFFFIVGLAALGLGLVFISTTIRSTLKHSKKFKKIENLLYKTELFNEDLLRPRIKPFS